MKRFGCARIVLGDLFTLSPLCQFTLPKSLSLISIYPLPPSFFLKLHSYPSVFQYFSRTPPPFIRLNLTLPFLLHFNFQSTLQSFSIYLPTLALSYPPPFYTSPYNLTYFTIPNSHITHFSSSLPLSFSLTLPYMFSNKPIKSSKPHQIYQTPYLPHHQIRTHTHTLSLSLIPYLPYINPSNSTWSCALMSSLGAKLVCHIDHFFVLLFKFLNMIQFLVYFSLSLILTHNLTFTHRLYTVRTPCIDLTVYNSQLVVISMEGPIHRDVNPRWHMIDDPRVSTSCRVPSFQVEGFCNGIIGILYTPSTSYLSLPYIFSL